MNIKLDFTLNSAYERTEWLNNYIKNFERPLTSDELEMMGNYLLWGKSTDGLNEVQRKSVQIETRSKTWDEKAPESLEGLMEQPGFSEAYLSRFIAPTKRQRVKFSREEALRSAPDYARAQYINLFHEIDETDFLVELWELAHNKRSKEIRKSLVDSLSEETKERLSERAKHLNQYQYLKMKHLLVELRRQQFFIKDSYTSPVQRDRVISAAAPSPTFGDSIVVAPIGFKGDSPSDLLIWRPLSLLNPFSFTSEELAVIRKRLTNEQNSTATFDWREPEHVYQFILQYEELRDAADEEDRLGTLRFMVDTLDFYIEFAQLSDLHKDILDRKIKHEKNVDIALYINKKYGKSYSNNYISTLFTKKIIPLICAAAKTHFDILERLDKPEDFKKCASCGTWLLREPENFMRRARSKDGYAPTCKKCDKIRKMGG